MHALTTLLGSGVYPINPRVFASRSLLVKVSYYLAIEKGINPLCDIRELTHFLTFKHLYLFSPIKVTLKS